MLPWESHEEAKAELDEAAAYYLKISFEVSLRFASVFHSGIRQIREMPFSAPRWPGRPDVRRLMLSSNFPYAVIYTIRDGELLVVALAHTSRKPGYWLHRLH